VCVCVCVCVCNFASHIKGGTQAEGVEQWDDEEDALVSRGCNNGGNFMVFTLLHTLLV